MDEEADPIKQFFPDDDEVDLYNVLGLTSSASTDDIKKSYRRLALSFHPDKQASSATEQERAATSLKFQQVGYAYTILSDATRRARYDETGRTDESFLQGVADSEGGWEGYFEAIFEKVSRQRLDEDKKHYQGMWPQALSSRLLANPPSPTVLNMTDALHISFDAFVIA
jgi:DnaJ family protein C protein 9